MGYTTPATHVAATVLTAARLNTDLRDNIAWIATDSPACRAYKATNFAHNSSSNWLGVPMDTERYDNASFHSTSSNTDRFTIPTGAGGKYVFGGSLIFAGGGGGTVYIAGAALNGLTAFAANHSGIPDVSAMYLSLNTNYAMAAADYFIMAGYQDSGGTVNILAGGGAALASPEAYAFWFRT